MYGKGNNSDISNAAANVLPQLPKTLSRHEIPLRQALRIINQRLATTSTPTTITPPRLTPPKPFYFTTTRTPLPPSPQHSLYPNIHNTPSTGSPLVLCTPPPLPPASPAPSTVPTSPTVVSLLVRMLDSAAGIVPQHNHTNSPSTTRQTHTGLTATSRAGLACLPLPIVRGVEHERLARFHNWTEMQISCMHALLSPHTSPKTWDITQIHDSSLALDYLTRASLVDRNKFARRALNWLTGDQQGKQTRQQFNSPADTRFAFFRAVESGDRRRAVKLGRLVVRNEDNETDIDVKVRADATIVMGMKPREQKAMAANNIGYLLQHGSVKREQNIKEAIRYYEMAVAWGSPAAACNLAHLLHCDDESDGLERARRLYELAIERGERNFAPRNLGLLLTEGKCTNADDVVYAAQCLLLGVREGDGTARMKCRKTLAKICRSFKFKMSASSELRKECVAAFQNPALDGWERRG